MKDLEQLRHDMLAAEKDQHEAVLKVRRIREELGAALRAYGRQKRAFERARLKWLEAAQAADPLPPLKRIGR